MVYFYKTVFMTFQRITRNISRFPFSQSVENELCSLTAYVCPVIRDCGAIDCLIIEKQRCPHLIIKMMFVLTHSISLVHISPTAFVDASQADRPPMSAFTHIYIYFYPLICLKLMHTISFSRLNVMLNRSI